ncbi:hypothetical protein AB835_11900 [Candidatus Endobugula sertula]|uniref:Uncharacterized protein n=1 Tax=Candidatus Endobugula sertula TaxID=62101 RepID=A0A1D2QMS7_9GAMM|nr:hypothetical protein AB835_11900 [Candidatus Endobugula sertula]
MQNQDVYFLNQYDETVMNTISRLLASLSAKEISAISSLEDLERIAGYRGTSVSAADVRAFLQNQQSNVANDNMSIDGTGSVVFGRDWYYPGPDVDPDNII